MTIQSRWIFAMPLPAAWLLSYVIVLLRDLMTNGVRSVVEIAGWTMLVGGICFPIGLPALVYRDARVLSAHIEPIILAIYAVYLVLTMWAVLQRSNRVLLLLVTLLILNVAGCQTETGINAIPLRT